MPRKHILALAAALVASAFTVTDGDTVRQGGKPYRIVGLNTPEMNGKCANEERLARQAARRLRELAPFAVLTILGGTCGYGRGCARITIEGRDWADMAVSEGLAESYTCSSGRCPKRRTWCSVNPGERR